MEKLTDMEVELERKLRFVRPVIGFPKSTNFLLSMIEDGAVPYLTLTSLDEDNLGFIVIPPGLLYNDYVIEIPEADAALLNLDDSDDVLVLTLVTYRKGEVPTANLLGPIVVNRTTGLAAQVVLSESDYRAAVAVNALSAHAA